MNTVSLLSRYQSSFFCPVSYLSCFIYTICLHYHLPSCSLTPWGKVLCLLLSRSSMVWRKSEMLSKCSELNWIKLTHTEPRWWLLFRHSGVSNPLQPPGLQQARLPCPSLSPGLCSNSCPWSWDVIQPSQCCPLLLQTSIFPSASGSFPVSQLFASGGQRIRASASVLLVNIQGWFPLGLTGEISLLYKWICAVNIALQIWCFNTSFFIIFIYNILLYIYI